MPSRSTHSPSHCFLQQRTGSRRERRARHTARHWTAFPRQWRVLKASSAVWRTTGWRWGSSVSRWSNIFRIGRCWCRTRRETKDLSLGGRQGDILNLIWRPKEREESLDYVVYEHALQQVEGPSPIRMKGTTLKEEIWKPTISLAMYPTHGRR